MTKRKTTTIQVIDIKAYIDCTKDIQDACTLCSQEIVKKASKGFGGKYSTGEYEIGWGWHLEKHGDGTIEGVVYNSRQPSLTHLLEFGHIVANQTGTHGRWYPPQKHIEPSYEKARGKFYPAMRNVRIIKK